MTLCEEIAYSSNGFFIKFDKNEQRIFCDDYNIREDKFNAMLDMLLQLNFFDKAMFDKYHILTNEQIQEAYIETKCKKKIEQVENVEYILPCFTSKIHELSLKLGGNVDKTSENNVISTQTKLNENIVDKSVNNIKENIKEATNEQVVNSTVVYTFKDIDDKIKNMNDTDKSRLKQLVTKFDDKESFSFNLVAGEYKISAYKVLFAMIDLLNASKDKFTIKIGNNAQSITKKTIIQMIYELTTVEFVEIVETVANRKDIRVLPFFVLGMIVRLDNKREEERRKMLQNENDYYKECEYYGASSYNAHLKNKEEKW